MTLYLTEETDPDDVAAPMPRADHRVKLYPAGPPPIPPPACAISTACAAVLEKMAEIGCPLCVHGEVTDPRSTSSTARPCSSTACWTRSAAPRRACGWSWSMTPPRRRRLRQSGRGGSGRHDHHASPGDQPQPHPRRAGSNRITIACRSPSARHTASPWSPRPPRAIRASFLGTDSAPHTDAAKESACGCAGCFTAPNTLPILAHVFEAEGALDKLEGLHLAQRPGLLRPAGTNDRHDHPGKGDAPAPCPAQVRTGDGPVTVFDPGFPLHWRSATSLPEMIRRQNSFPRQTPHRLSPKPRNRPPHRAHAAGGIGPCISTPMNPSRWPRACPRPPISTAAS